MNKLLQKVARVFLGLSMAAGVGVAIANSSKKVEKTDAVNVGDKITAIGDIENNAQYRIGVTISGTNYYWKMQNDDYSVTSSRKGVDTTSTSDAAVVTFEGSGSSWYIKLSNGNYLSLHGSSNSNMIITNAANKVAFTASNQTSAIRLSVGSRSLQRNSQAGTHNFGSYGNTQKDVWLQLVEHASSVKVSSMSIDQNDQSFDGQNTGYAFDLTASITYSGGTGTGVTWSSSDETVALASSKNATTGTITLKGNGSTTITATSKEDSTVGSVGTKRTDSITVTVTNIVAEKGEQANPYTVAEALVVLEALAKDTNNGKVVFVRGVITGSANVNNQGNGTFNIRDEEDSTKVIKAYSISGCSSTEGSSGYVADGYKVLLSGALINYGGTLEVGYASGFSTSLSYSLAPSVTGVTAVKASPTKTYYTGNKLSASDFTVTVSYDTISDQVITTGFTWKVGGVEDGTLAEGENTVVVFVGTNHSGDLTFVGVTVHIVSLTVDSPLNLIVGNSASVTYTAEPEGYVDTISFSSDKPGIATVNETTGEVTAVAKGTATITVSTSNGLSEACTVRVSSLPQYTDLFTVQSSSVITGSGYGAGQTKDIEFEIDETPVTTSWIITHGGNSKSVGTNSGNRDNCKLGDSYFKYAAGVSGVTKTSIAAAFVSTTKIDYDVARISYTVSGGSNQTSSNVYLISSSDGNTFTTVSVASGSAIQGHTLSTGATFALSSAAKAYYGLLFVCTNTTGAWRIDDVNITFASLDIERELVSVTLSEDGAKTSYVDGDSVSFNGLVATALYDDDYEKIVTSHCTITADKQTVSLSDDSIIYSATYDDDGTVVIQDFELPIVVEALAITGIEKTATYDFKKDFKQNEAFSIGQAILKAVYNNGNKETITLETEGVTVTLGGVNITGQSHYMELSDASKEVVISYCGFSLSYNISTVSEAEDIGDGYWELVTNSMTLADGDLLVMGYYNDGFTTMKASSSYNSSKYISAVDVNIDSETKHMTVNSSVAYFTLGEATGGWTLTSSVDGLIGLSSSSNNNISKEASSNNVWSISVDASSNATITNTSYSSGSNSLYYNSNSPRFSNYGTSSNMQPLRLWRFVESTRTADESAVDTFVVTYMHLSDVSINNHSDTGECRDVVDPITSEVTKQGYYSKAKAGYNSLTEAQKLIFGTYEEFDISRARERLIDWATANREVFDPLAYTFTPVSGANLGITSLFGTNNTNTAVIIVIVSLVSVSAIGGYFFLRRKEQD